MYFVYWSSHWLGCMLFCAALRSMKVCVGVLPASASASVSRAASAVPFFDVFTGFAVAASLPTGTSFRFEKRAYKGERPCTIGGAHPLWSTHREDETLLYYLNEAAFALP